VIGPLELGALARKYRVMGELRRALPAHAVAGVEDEPLPDETPEQKGELRQFAAEFPGALRELDTLASDEIDRRRAALEHAAAGGAVEPWMEWMHAYHALMRAALAVKRALARGPLDDAARARLAAAGSPVDDAFLDAVAAPPHGRLNVVVFSRLATQFSTPASEIWDALYPRRAGERPYRG
jgi:hypothetical protein